MISEEALKRAALAADAALLEQMPSREACEHTFSPGFERKMKRLIKRTKHPVVYPLLQRAACVLLAAMLTGTVILVTVPQAQAAFFGWLKEIHDTYLVYRIPQEAESTDQQDYRLTWVPEGYVESCIDDWENVISIDYIHKDDPQGEHRLSFMYFYANGSGALSVVSEDDAVHKETEVNGIPADLLIDPSGETGNTILWEDPETHTLFWIDAYVEEDVLIKMAESVEPYEK